jgi:exodeoxyribonuclease III
VRLMTYNILRGGKDADSDARLAAVCRLIRQVAPDILVLQECNDFERDGMRTFHRVERELGMRGVLSPAHSGFHVALFVRHAQLIETRLLEREMHHASLAAHLELGSFRCVVVGAHLCPFGGELRLAEARILSRFVREENVFVLGDLNSISPHDAAAQRTDQWRPRHRARHQLPGTGGQLDTRAISALEECGLTDTFRAAGASAPTAQTRFCPTWQNFQVRIDYVLASPAAADRVTRVELIDGELADQASDHYPLFVDIET